MLAWASFIARSFALVLLLAALWQGRGGVSISGQAGWRPDFGVARQVLAIGVPAALEQVMAYLMWQRFRRTVAEF